MLKFYTFPMFLHPVRNFVNKKSFLSKHVSTFLPRKYDVKGTYARLGSLFKISLFYTEFDTSEILLQKYQIL